jgi:RHS repeat-associated protein
MAMRQDDVVYFIHADHLGSTSLTTDITGTLVAETRYLPYGEERWITGTLVTDFTFTGQRADSYIKLMEMGARWYDPQIGRWISPDSIIPNPANPQSLNHYTYGYNNPVRYYDSDGHCFPFCTAALAYGALRTLPRETLGFGSRQLAEAGIPIVSDFAAWDARTTDQLWQAANGVDLQGNPLTTEGQVEIGVEGYANLLGEAATVTAMAEGAGALWQIGKSLSNARGGTAPPATPLGATGPTQSSSSVTTLYRAVSGAEYEQLMKTGKFEAAGGAEGKYFATTYDHAAMWGQKMMGEGNFRVVQTQVPNEAVQNFYYFSFLDRIGPAYYATMEQLQNLLPVIQEAQ